MHRYLVFYILFTCKSIAVPVASDMALVQIALNTLNSVRELNEIVTESRKFGKNFETIVSKVDQAIWKADRVAMWMNDMKELSETKIENIDDFNFVLRSLKDQTSYLRGKLITYYRIQQQTEKDIKKAKKGEIKDKDRAKKYAGEIKLSLSPALAQVETAKNTKDMTVELAKMNAKLHKLTAELATLTKLQRDSRDELIRKKLRENKSLGVQKKGILNKRDLKTR